MVYEINTDKLTLQFKGRQADVDAIKLENLKPSVDVAGLTEGVHRLPLIITSPSQAKLVQQVHAEVKISKTPETPAANMTD
jgi:YbbR domain-containing protein